MEHFFSPNSDEDQIEKGLHQKWNTFCPNSSRDLRSDAHQSQIGGRNADEDHTQIVGGHISLLSPGFWHPWARPYYKSGVVTVEGNTQ